MCTCMCTCIYVCAHMYVCIYCPSKYISKDTYLTFLNAVHNELNSMSHRVTHTVLLYVFCIYSLCSLVTLHLEFYYVMSHSESPCDSYLKRVFGAYVFDVQFPSIIREHGGFSHMCDSFFRQGIVKSEKNAKYSFPKHDSCL